MNDAETPPYLGIDLHTERGHVRVAAPSDGYNSYPGNYERSTRYVDCCVLKIGLRVGDKPNVTAAEIEDALDLVRLFFGIKEKS